MTGMTYKEVTEKIKAAACPTCKGSGKCNDAEAGDIGYNEWTCTSCSGTGWASSPPSVKGVNVAEAVPVLKAAAKTIDALSMLLNDKQSEIDEKDGYITRLQNMLRENALLPTVGWKTQTPNTDETQPQKLDDTDKERK